MPYDQNMMDDKMKQRPVISNYTKGVFCIQCFQFWNIDKLRDVFVNTYVRDALNSDVDCDICLVLTAEDVKYTKPFIFPIMDLFERSYGVNGKVVIVVPDAEGAKKLDVMLAGITKHTDSPIIFCVVSTVDEANVMLGIE